MAVCRDVTDRHRAEEALRRSQNQHEDLVASVDGIVWEADARTFQFLFVSRQPGGRDIRGVNDLERVFRHATRQSADRRACVDDPVLEVDQIDQIAGFLGEKAEEFLPLEPVLDLPAVFDEWADLTPDRRHCLQQFVLWLSNFATEEGEHGRDPTLQCHREARGRLPSLGWRGVGDPDRPPALPDLAGQPIARTESLCFPTGLGRGGSRPASHAMKLTGGVIHAPPFSHLPAEICGNSSEDTRRCFCKCDGVRQCAGDGGPDVKAPRLSLPFGRSGHHLHPSSVRAGPWLELNSGRIHCRRE